ncbi:MAG: hypothetical protein IH805_10420 [Proteobacteria bacterium]|nr:hypothetical protein [Pseudomonadota bacterium]
MVSTERGQDLGERLNSPVESTVSEASQAAAGGGADILILDSGTTLNQATEETVLLELEDLLPDASGEVVLFAGEELPVNIVTNEPLTDAGIAEAHVTAAGVDVTGLHFYSFESGITLYSPTDLLIVTESGTI